MLFLVDSYDSYWPRPSLYVTQEVYFMLFMPYTRSSFWHYFPGTCPTNGISIEFEIRSNFGVLLSIICSIDHNDILHTSQLHCRDVGKISLWSGEHILNQSTASFDLISNSIKISLVEQAPGRHKSLMFVLHMNPRYATWPITNTLGACWLSYSTSTLQ